MTTILLVLTGLVVGGAIGLAAGLKLAKAPTPTWTESTTRCSVEQVPAATIIPLFVGGPSRYAVVSDAGTVKFPSEDDDATNGLAARKAFESVTVNPDGQCWSFLENGTVRSRVGVVS